jgi:hypothetical protein
MKKQDTAILAILMVLCTLGLVEAFFGGGGNSSDVPLATSTRAGKVKGGGIGVDIAADGTLSASGVAVPISIQPFSNLSAALRDKYDAKSTASSLLGTYSTSVNGILSGKVSNSTLGNYTSHSNSEVSELQTSKITKPPSVSQYYTIPVFSNTTGNKLIDSYVTVAALESKMNRSVNGTPENTYGVWTNAVDNLRELRRIDYSQLTSLPTLPAQISCPAGQVFGRYSSSGNFKCIDANPNITIASGKSVTINNVLAISGTDGTTLTFPTTSAFVAANDMFYGGVFLYDNTTATSISNTGVYHALTLASTGLVNGFTYKAGKITSISAFATYSTGGSHTKITAAGHTIDLSMPITVVGTTNYNGTYLTKWVDTNTFVITKAYQAEAGGGTVRLPVTLKANTGSSGIYEVSFHASGTNTGENKDYKIEMNVNATAKDNVVSERRLSVITDISPFSASGLVEILEGQYLWGSIKNITDTTSITLKHYNFNAHRL